MQMDRDTKAYFTKRQHAMADVFANVMEDFCAAARKGDEPTAQKHYQSYQAVEDAVHKEFFEEAGFSIAQWTELVMTNGTHERFAVVYEKHADVLLAKHEDCDEECKTPKTTPKKPTLN